MKRTLACLAVLLVASMIGTAAIGGAVYAERDRVEIYENAVVGDSSLAKGIGISMLCEYGDRLFWNTAYTVGGTAETEFEFCADEKTVASERTYDGVDLGLNYVYGVVNDAPISELSGMALAYRELYEETPIGGSLERTVRIADYYDYYPISVGISLPGTFWSAGVIARFDDKADFPAEAEVWEKFNDFFKIPVGDDDSVTIGVTRDSRGQPVGISSGREVGPNLYSYSAYTYDRCFFALNGKYEDAAGNIRYIDTSLIPGGYGIYAFDYEHVWDEPTSSSGAIQTVNNTEKGTGIDADSLACVYPLDRETVVRGMAVSPNERFLWLLTEDDGRVMFTVIDIADMTDICRITVGESDDYYGFYPSDKHVVIYGGTAEDGRRLMLINTDDNGEARVVFGTEHRALPDDMYYDMSHTAKSFYDGQRLAILNYLYTNDGVDMVGFTLEVYTADGGSYYGEYLCSLDLVRSSRYNENCHIATLDFANTSN